MNSIREDLKAYVDGELDSRRAAEVEAALRADPELQEEVEYMRVLGMEIKRIAAEPAVSGRAAAIERARRSPKWAFSRLPFAAQAAAVIALVGLVSFLSFPLFAPAPYAAKRETLSADAAKTMAPEEAPVDSEAGSPAGQDRDAFTSNRRMDVGGGGLPPMAGSELADKPVASLPPPTTAAESKERSVPQAKSGSGQPPTAVPLRESARLIVKNADLALRVDDVAKSMAQAGTVAESLGGFVLNSSAANLREAQPTGFVTLRIPASRFDAAMRQLRELGEVSRENSSGEDVTAQVADLDARIKVLRAEEESYITMLRAARKVGEMLEIKERLSAVRQEIESHAAQVKSLKDLATLSTITCNFEQKVAIRPADETDEGGFSETWNGAVNGLRAAFSAIGRMLIVIFVYSPIWLPVAIGGWWLLRRLSKN